MTNDRLHYRRGPAGGSLALCASALATMLQRPAGQFLSAQAFHHPGTPFSFLEVWLNQDVEKLWELQTVLSALGDREKQLTNKPESFAAVDREWQSVNAEMEKLQAADRAALPRTAARRRRAIRSAGAPQEISGAAHAGEEPAAVRGGVERDRRHAQAGQRARRLDAEVDGGRRCFAEAER